MKGTAARARQLAVASMHPYVQTADQPINLFLENTSLK